MREFIQWLRNLGGVDFEGRHVHNIQSLHVGGKGISPEGVTLRVTGRSLLWLSYTTAERDAIVNWNDGEVIYNTTTSKFQGRSGGAWVDFH